MIKFTVATEIARPATEVFRYVTDPAKLATWQTNTISAVAEDDQPVGLGSRVRAVHLARARGAPRAWRQAARVARRGLRI